MVTTIILDIHGRPKWIRHVLRWR